jgi:hypothetical protein
MSFCAMDPIFRSTALSLKINNSILGRHHFKGKRILENALGILYFNSWVRHRYPVPSVCALKV